MNQASFMFCSDRSFVIFPKHGSIGTTDKTMRKAEVPVAAMVKNIEYTTRGTCSRQIKVQIEDGIIQSVQFIGGCDGNTKGIAQLVRGMKAEDVIKRLKGTDCGGKGTSCPDQLALALEQALKNNDN